MHTRSSESSKRRPTSGTAAGQRGPNCPKASRLHAAGTARYDAHRRCGPQSAPGSSSLRRGGPESGTLGGQNRAVLPGWPNTAPQGGPSMARWAQRDVGRSRPIFADFGPNLATLELGLNLVEAGHCCSADIGRSQQAVGLEMALIGLEPEDGHIRPNFDPNWSDFGQVWLGFRLRQIWWQIWGHSTYVPRSCTGCVPKYLLANIVHVRLLQRAGQ